MVLIIFCPFVPADSKKPKQNKTKQPKYNKLNNKYSKDCEDKCVAWPNVFLWRFLFDLCENTLYVALRNYHNKTP